MVARDIPFVCTDVDRKHDGYGVDKLAAEVALEI